MGTGRDGDEMLLVLDEVVSALREMTERNEIAIRRAEEIRTMRRRGIPYSEIVPQEERPLIVELLTMTLADLSEVGSRLRRAEARVLHSEGLTMEQIAELFGVTRQRVSALLSG